MLCVAMMYIGRNCELTDYVCESRTRRMSIISSVMYNSWMFVDVVCYSDAYASQMWVMDYVYESRTRRMSIVNNGVYNR